MKTRIQTLGSQCGWGVWSDHRGTYNDLASAQAVVDQDIVSGLIRSDWRIIQAGLDPFAPANVLAKGSFSK